MDIILAVRRLRVYWHGEETAQQQRQGDQRSAILPRPAPKADWAHCRRRFDSGCEAARLGGSPTTIF